MAVPAFTKRKTKFHVHLTNSEQATAHGGQLLVDALCRRFNLWKRVNAESSLEHRKRTGVGFAPVSLVAQLLFTLTSGGASLADAERLGQDRVLLDLLGLDKGADQTTLGEWLRAQTKESVLGLLRINAELVDWASQQAKPGRWLHGGEVEIFFDDTQIEVEGHHFEGARINYEGNRALGWQTLWYGPWLLDGILDGAGDVSEHLPVLLDEHQHRWQGRPSYLYADSGSSAGKYLNRIGQAGLSRWSISYNKWTDKLDVLAAELPESQWSALPPADQPQEQYTWVKHQPGECQQAQKFAAVRWKNNGDLMWRYAYRVCQAGDTDSPQAVFERHRLKGAKEQGFSEVLSGLDLHHPPCKDLMANQAFYAIAMLAYNVLLSLKVLDLPDDAQGWRIHTMIRYLLTVHVSVSTHARYDVARICIPAGWLRWWRLFIDQWVPKRKPGRPVTEAVDST
jgi:hypothetical protein